MIQVPQRKIIREYVTEEIVETEVVTYEEVPTRTRYIKQVPAPTKRIPVKTQTYTPQPVKQIIYRKGD